MEHPLTGGRLTTGVVRVGDTVRRPVSQASRFVAELLAHLASKGFDGCPRHHGRDEQGRDVLTFIPGQVPARWRRFADDQVEKAARLLRQLHDASRDFAAAHGGAVVCHNDPGPNNTVFRADRPVAFIDFDFAAPGRPLADVGYLAWAWCLSSRPDRGPVAEQARQVRLLADAYGLADADRRRLPEAICERQRRNAALHDELGNPRVIAWTLRELAYTEANRDALTAALSR